MKVKFWKIGLMTSLLTISLSLPALAGQWKEEDGGWKYVENDGSLVTGSWRMSADKKSYYLGTDGLMVKDSLVSDNGNLYYVGSDGAMYVNQWKGLVDADDPNLTNWYYFGESGKAYKSTSDKAAPRLIGDKKYLFDADGKMVTGLVNSSGQAVDPTTSNKFVEATYYFGPDGAMYSGQWYKYYEVAEPDFRSQLGQKEYSEFGEMWMYFDTDGKKVKTNNIESVKVKEIDGKNYVFDENGIMIPGLSVSNANVNATSSNAKYKYAADSEDGQLKKDFWAFRVANEAMSEQDYNSQEYSWFRTNSEGKVLKNKIYSVYNRKYAFDRLGRMQTGFVIMYYDGTFAQAYKVDTWTKADFLQTAADSPIPGIDRGNLYFFGADELNDGSMKTGEEVYVDIADGRAVFGFKPSGIAYGSGSTLVRHRNKFYYNGLRLDADEDLGYGIVKDTTQGSNNTWLVVDRDGRVVKGNRKVLKDGSDSWIIIMDNKFFARVSASESPNAPKFRNDGSYWTYDSSFKGNDRFLRKITAADGDDDKNDNNFVVFSR